MSDQTLQGVVAPPTAPPTAKSFSTYLPSDVPTFDINGRVFRCRPIVPGATLLDFLSKIDNKNPTHMAGAITNLLDAAILPEDKAAWDEFIRDPANAVTLTVLAEVAGFVADKLAGVDPTLSPGGPSSTG